MPDRTVTDFSGWTYSHPHHEKNMHILRREEQQLAFFKSHWSGPHQGVDYVVSRLAFDVGLQTPEVALYEVDGKRGLLSVSVPLPHDKWSLAAPLTGNYDRPVAMFRNVTDLTGMFVFDCWVGNADRHGENVLLRTVGPNFWEIWPIDHGHAFWGTHWLKDYDHEGTQNPFNYVNLNTRLRGTLLYKALLSTVQTQDDLLDWVQRIQQLADRHVGYAAACQEAGLLTGDEAVAIDQILKARRECLAEMVTSWHDAVLSARKAG